MRIAYLTGEYPRATDTFIQREVAELREIGVEVFTFSVRRTGDEHIVGEEQIAERDRTFYILPVNPISLLWTHLVLSFSAPWRFLKALRLAWTTRQLGLRGTLYQLFYFAEAGILVKQIHRLRIQHLHNHFANSSCSVSMLAAELGGFTYSFTMHGPAIFFEPELWRIDEKIKRALFVSCISYYCRSQGMIFAPPDKWNRMHIVHCGVNPNLFQLVPHNRPTKRLLYVGRLASVKGLPVLFESIAILEASHPEIELTLVGDGLDRRELERLAFHLRLDKNIKFVGYQSQAEVREYMQQTDIFVLPSFAEGVPVVLMEAMAAGVPVVATRVAGVSELVEDGVNGYLVSPSNVHLLANRIQRLLTDHKLREKIGRAGRAKVIKDFNIRHETKWLHRVMTAAFQGKVESIRPNVIAGECSSKSMYGF